MTLLYLDTSALLRLYTQEPEFELVTIEKEQASGVVCHQVTYVEAVAALSGRRARKLMGARAFSAVLTAFKTDWPSFRHVGIDETLLLDAADLAQKYRLRAYDAVHLSAAQAISPLGMRFMTFDLALRSVAEQVLPGQVWTP